MTTFELDRGDFQRLTKRLNKLDAELQGPRVADFLRKEAQPWVRTRAYERFRTQGDAAVGGPWQQLLQSTISWRRFYIKRDGLRIQEHKPINVRTGKLRAYVARSFDVAVTGPYKAELTQPSKRNTQAYNFTKLRKAQRGDFRTVARPVIALDERDKHGVEKIAHAWTERILRAR